MNETKRPLADITATELMVRYRQGEKEAFIRLYDRYKARVYGYLRKRLHNPGDVDEIFQDVFLRLHQSRFRYREKFPFEPWLFTIVRNSLIDHYRKKGKEAGIISLEELAVPPASPPNHNRQTELAAMLPEEAALTEHQRQAVELRYGKDFSFAEIAAALDTSPANARQLVSRALKRLRFLLHREETK